MKFTALAFFVFVLAFNTYSSVIVTDGFFINEKSSELMKVLGSRPEFTIDHVKENGFELYGPKGLEQFLIANKIKYSSLPENRLRKADLQGYLTPEEIEKELKSLNKKYPEISKLYSIGKSVQKRDLWVMKLSSNAQIDDDRPEFKYIANMHGNEIVGRELMLAFIKDCLFNYSKDKRIKNILDKFQVHILVSMNPDGAKAARRGNASGVDLNRDFPDFDTSDNVDIPDNRAPETQAVMNWQAIHRFKLSANFHGGAEVVNYPWDTVAEQSPIDQIVKTLSLSYAKNAPYIGSSTVFSNGITNGFAWYEVKGGMQDWSIYWRDDLQLTIELSNDKWPNYSKIDYYYQQNRSALISYIEQLEYL